MASDSHISGSEQRINPKLGPLVYNGGPTFLDGSQLLTRAQSARRRFINSSRPTNHGSLIFHFF